MTSLWTQRLASVILCAAGLVGMVAPASAKIIVTTTYDPEFGAGPLLGYSWKATINYEIPLECIASTGPKGYLPGLVFGCGDFVHADEFKVLSAQVGIYQNGSPGNLLDVMTFDKASLPLFAAQLQVTAPVLPATEPLLAKVLYVLSLDLIPPFDTSDEVRGHILGLDQDIRFRIRLNEFAQLQYICDTCSGWTTPVARPTVSFKQWADKTDFETVVKPSTALKIGVIPEPGSMALVLLALGVGMAATRRR